MIRLPVRRISSLQSMIDANPDSFHRYMVRIIGKALIEGKSSVDLFKFGFTPATVIAPKEQWPQILTQAMKYFISTESYENAAQCRKILDRLFINSI